MMNLESEIAANQPHMKRHQKNIVGFSERSTLWRG